MDAGKLRHLIIIQKETTAKDSEGVSTQSWQEFAKSRAAAEPLKGREYFQAAAVSAENTVRFCIRYRPGINTAMRVLYGTRVFNIRSIIDVEERHIELQLMCEEVVAGE